MEEETELAPQAMPRVFWWAFREWDWIEELESMLFFLLLPFPCKVEEREESKLVFAEYGEKWRKKEELQLWRHEFKMKTRGRARTEGRMRRNLRGKPLCSGNTWISCLAM